MKIAEIAAEIGKLQGLMGAYSDQMSILLERSDRQMKATNETNIALHSLQEWKDRVEQCEHDNQLQNREGGINLKNGAIIVGITALCNGIWIAVKGLFQ